MRQQFMHSLRTKLRWLIFSWILACPASGSTAARRPNFVYILLDDMNFVLGDEEAVKQTRALIADQGVRATNAFVSSPKCTPSRSAWLSGRFYHNLRPHAATRGRGLNTTHFFDVDAIFPTLHRNGYQTALFGKIHNDQASWLCREGGNHTEPFTHIETECQPCGNYFPKAFVTKTKDDRYTKMEMLEDDDPRTHYSHAQYGNRSTAWIRAAAHRGPFFCFIGTTGPHLPSSPAPWHEAIAKELNISAPRTPSFNMWARDHNHLLATHAALSERVVEGIDNLMRMRWGTLLSIDDLVAGVVKTLEDVAVLDNTYILFSSDHGYHLGQFRIPIEKMLPYDTDIRIPLFIRGPRIKAGTKLDDMVANIDIAPTILDFAGIPVPPIMDGISMAPILTGASAGRPFRTHFISEFAEGVRQTYEPFGLYDEPQNQWRMLRVINATHNFAFVEWDQLYMFDNIDFCEYYDLARDPWQLLNLWNSTSSAMQDSMRAELRAMYSCRGTRTEISNCTNAFYQMESLLEV